MAVADAFDLDSPYNKPHRRVNGLKTENEPLLNDSDSKAWRRKRTRRIKLVSVVLLVLAVLFIAFVVFFPFSIILGRYFSERFESSKHSPAIINLDEGRATLHFNGSFRVRNTLPINILNVALEVDYMYVGVDPAYPLALSLTPELLELDTNASITVYLDRDFDLYSERNEVRTSSRSKNREKTDNVFSNNDQQAFSMFTDWQPRVEQDGTVMHTHRMLKDAFLPAGFMSGINEMTGNTPPNEIADKPQANAPAEQSADKEMENFIKEAMSKQNQLQRRSTGAKTRKQAPAYASAYAADANADTAGPDGENNGMAKPAKGDFGVRADPRFESALVNMYTECKNTGQLKFHIQVKFYYHIIFNLWRVLREQAFEYVMNCETTDGYGNAAKWDRAEY